MLTDLFVSSRTLHRPVWLCALNRIMTATASAAGFADTKPHYGILDGLRGVAALMVVWYHICEGYAFAAGDAVITGLNHGYLAVDFFFILSGFVLGYAYDDRWAGGFTVRDFAKRRFIRLHPMVIMGAVIGVAAFLIQGGVQWDGTRVATSAVMLALLFAMFMIPAVPGCPYELRGNGEMFPLNGPAWSLFFEYVGNILYALFIRRLPTKTLAALAAVLGLGLGTFAIGNFSGYDSIGVGWTLDGVNFFGGLLRMLFPFTMGILISRVFRPVKVKAAFWICSAVLAAVFAVPHISSECFAAEDGTAQICLNGIFETVCIVILFPALLWTAASDSVSGRTEILCRALGDLSYPLYITHYPVMYLFYAWMMRTGRHDFPSTWWQSLIVYAVCVLLAILCLNLYDKPLRRRLAARFLKN